MFGMRELDNLTELRSCLLGLFQLMIRHAQQETNLECATQAFVCRCLFLPRLEQGQNVVRRAAL